MPFEPVFEEVELKSKSGKVTKVTLRNLNGADEMWAVSVLGKEIKQEEPIAGMMLLNNMLFVMSITLIDDQQVAPPKNYSDALQFLAKFSKKDLDKLRLKYQELNADEEEDFLEESKN